MERDEESGFIYIGARYYCPWLARWLAVDPLESKYAPESSYNYCHNNPVRFTDPSGMGTGDGDKKVSGVKLYEVEEHSGNIPTNTTDHSGETINVKEFSIVPSYRDEKGKQVLDHYTAFLPHRYITENGLREESVPVYLIGKNDLQVFKDHRTFYSLQAAAYYDGMNNSHMSEYSLQSLLGNDRAAAQAKWTEFKENLKSPYLWLSLGESLFRPKFNEPAPSSKAPSKIQGLTNEQYGTVSQKIINKVGHISDDIVVQGSRASGTAKPNSDIDFAIKVDSKQFYEILKQRFGHPNYGSSKWRTMTNAIETGKIQAGEAGLSGLSKDVKNYLGIDVDISIIKKGGAFDNGYQIPLIRR